MSSKINNESPFTEFEGKLREMSIRKIAGVIRGDWREPYFGAVPYLSAFSHLNKITENYYFDSGESIVKYFLSNASTWRGEVARAVKKELKRRLK